MGQVSLFILLLGGLGQLANADLYADRANARAAYESRVAEERSYNQATQQITGQNDLIIGKSVKLAGNHPQDLRCYTGPFNIDLSSDSDLEFDTYQSRYGQVPVGHYRGTPSIVGDIAWSILLPQSIPVRIYRGLEESQKVHRSYPPQITVCHVVLPNGSACRVGKGGHTCQ